MTRSDINHVLITRFNLPSPGPESLVRAQPGWLEARVDLFDRYCVPSVLAQKSRNFSWMIYFDPESPQWLLKRIERFEADGIFLPVFRATVNHHELLADIRRRVGREETTLITTNLDNDDGLAGDFVERVQATVSPHPRAAIYLTNGLIARANELYLHRDRRNAFCSVRESWTEPATCWYDWHNLLGHSMPVIEVGGNPAWLQVVHGTNVSNRVHGRLVSPARYEASFGSLLSASTAPSSVELTMDRLIRAPARILGSVPRRAAKWIALRLFGKSGLDWIKLRLQGAAK
ncbi:MAG TPA: glycosyltransferase [Glaciibacter sp.]|nr:glycosyltransferase [Glaciibacter sp.]